MYAFFDKFGKKILAVAAALLIVVFLLPPNFGGGGGGGGGPGGRLGMLDGQPVTFPEAQAAVDRLRELTALIRPMQDPRFGGMTRNATIPELIFGQQLVNQFLQDPLQWYLLVTEARNGGVAVPDAELDELLSDPTRYRKSPEELIPLTGNFNPSVRDRLKEYLREAAAVRLYVERGMSAIKISQPLIEDHLARHQQQIQLRISAIDAGQYAGEIKSVSDEALREQFNTYASNSPGNFDERNPFGFGYRIPDRVRIQYIAIPRAEIERAVIASKDESMWEEEAILYHMRNPQEFQTSIDDHDAATRPSATKPTTRPYAEARSDVLQAMRQPLIEQRELAIINRLTQQLQADFQRAAGPVSATQPATTQQVLSARTANGAEFGSFDYLQKLADDVQKQFQVKLTLVNEARLLGADGIRQLPGIGTADVEEPAQPMSLPRSTADYLLQSTRPLLSGEALNQPGLIDLLQPTRLLRGPEAAYIARVLEAEKSHPPATLDEVRQQVEQDVRTRMAYDRAVEEAEKILAAARTAGDLHQAPGAGVVQTTSYFDGSGFADLGLKDAESWSFQLINPAFQMLREVKSVDALPHFSLIRLHRENKVIVAQLMDIKTRLDADQAALARLQAESEVAQSLMRGVSFDQWFSYDAVARRLGFERDDRSGGPAEPDSQPRPMNPFAP